MKGFSKDQSYKFYIQNSKYFSTEKYEYDVKNFALHCRWNPLKVKWVQTDKVTTGQWWCEGSRDWDD